MFTIGDLVVYGGEGVCRVVGICTPNVPGADKTREYYQLEPLYHNGSVLTPVDTGVLMRLVMSMAEAKALLTELPAVVPDDMSDPNLRVIKEHYHEVCMSYDCRRMIALIKSTCRKRKWAIEHGKKVSQLDERYLKRAEDHLYGELAVALEIPRESVVAYIKESYPAWPEGIN